MKIIFLVLGLKYLKFWTKLLFQFWNRNKIDRLKDFWKKYPRPRHKSDFRRQEVVMLPSFIALDYHIFFYLNRHFWTTRSILYWKEVYLCIWTKKNMFSVVFFAPKSEYTNPFQSVIIPKKLFSSVWRLTQSGTEATMK